MAHQQFKHLTLAEQVDFFMENAFVVTKNDFTKEKAAEWTENIWVRLGLDPNDKSTWDGERIHMPWHRREDVASCAPNVWEVMKECIDQPSGSWGDSFIVNLGAEVLEKIDVVDPKALNDWHIDGDFFVYYLDSPEQALLVIPVLSDIKPRGGGTFIAPEGIDMVAKYLAAHPEGVLPTGITFTPSTSTYADPKDDPGYYSHLQEVKKCTKFFEITGENHLRISRVITNPPVSLREPFNFNREKPDDFSSVEKKTLKALTVDRVDYKTVTERRRIVPKSKAAKDKLKLEEERWLAELATKNQLGGISPSSATISVA